MSRDSDAAWRCYGPSTRLPPIAAGGCPDPPAAEEPVERRQSPGIPEHDIARGAKAREWRESLKLSRRALSVVCGVSTASVQDIERGYRLRREGEPSQTIPAGVWRRYALICAGVAAVMKSSDALPF
jgi:helix-turn-helix protein